MWNAGLDEAKAGIRIAGININNLRYADDTTLMTKSEEELKNLLMKVTEESEKAGLKPSIKNMKIMASGPITPWQIDGGEMETVTDFIFLGSKITTSGDFNHEIKMLVPWKKSYDQPRQCIKRQRHHFADKGLSSQSWFFPVVMYGCESDPKEGWVLKNGWFWTTVLKILESPLNCKEIKKKKKSIPKEISPKYSLEGLMLKLKLQYFGHLMQKTNSLEKTPMLGKVEGRRRRGP